MIKHISLQDYTSFFNQQEIQSVSQSPEMVESYLLRNIEHELLGYYNHQNQLIYAALILYQNLNFGLKQASLVYGPIGKVEATESLKLFFTDLRKYLAKKSKVIRLVISPNYVHQVYDTSFNPISEVLDQEMINLLSEIGFKYLGDHLIGLSNRWIMVKDIKNFSSEEDVFASYHKQIRKTLNKLEEFHLEIDELSLNDLDRFIAIEKHTETTREFKARDEYYYYKTFEAFDASQKAKVTVAKFNMHQYRDNLKTKLEDVQEQLEQFYQQDLTPHLQKKINVANEQLQSFQNKLDKILELILKYPQETVDIAARFYLRTDQEYLAMYGGSLRDFSFIPATTALYDDILRKCYRENIPIYNYFGIYTEDDIGGQDSDILKFKKGFGGEIQQLIGEFELILKPLQNKLYESLKTVYHRLRK